MPSVEVDEISPLNFVVFNAVEDRLGGQGDALRGVARHLMSARNAVLDPDLLGRNLV